MKTIARMAAVAAIAIGTLPAAIAAQAQTAYGTAPAYSGRSVAHDQDRGLEAPFGVLAAPVTVDSTGNAYSPYSTNTGGTARPFLNGRY